MDNNSGVSAHADGSLELDDQCSSSSIDFNFTDAGGLEVALWDHGVTYIHFSRDQVKHLINWLQDEKQD